MPTLKTFNNAKVVVYFNDHPPPHVHVVLRDRRECLVDLATFEVQGVIPKRDIREALEWIKESVDYLHSEWKRINP